MNLQKIQEKASTWIMNRLQVLKNGGSVEEMDALTIAKTAIDRVTPIKAITPLNGEGYACPRCGHHFEGKQHYCHNCGQHVSYRGTEDQKYNLITENRDFDVTVEKGIVEISFGGTTVYVPKDVIVSLEEGTASEVSGKLGYKAYH